MIDAARTSTKCRIPQRLQSGRNKPPFITNTSRPKCPEPTKQKLEVVTQNNRFTVRNPPRSRSDEQSRPKSANRVKEDLFSGRYAASRVPRTDKNNNDRNFKRPSTLPKMLINETSIMATKTARPSITVPVTQRPPGMKVHAAMKNTSDLPDQETIKKHEDLELRQSDISDATHMGFEPYDRESITSQSDKVMQLKINWQDKTVLFEKMKNDLTDRQKAILELYAVMRSIHQKMTSFGEQANLPPAEDLRIMNVTTLTPEQLLQLCSDSDTLRHKDAHFLCQNSLAIDVNKLYNMPSKLVDTCEQTLQKRKEIIDWFDSLKSLDKGISVHKLSKKINEFNSENEMMKCALDQVKAEFAKELEEIIICIRNGVNETIALQLRIEEMTCELSQLNSQNADLRKQIHNAEHLRSQTNKTRVEELQKELKEEKCKRIFVRDRLARAEGQVKLNVERASQLEAALGQAHSQTWNLERTIQQLNEQNKKLQSDFDKELNTLNESIREHTVNLEEIADAREKLQNEKEDLEKHLNEIAVHYDESLKNFKHEKNMNIVKLIETENKYRQEAEDKTKLQSKVESLYTQLREAELRLEDAKMQLQVKQNEIDEALNVEKELETTKKELEVAKNELDEAKLETTEYREGLTKQNEIIAEIQRSYKESKNLIHTVTSDLSTKDEYISELEKKQSIMEQQLQENESKLEEYKEQLSSLKSHITQLQEDFGEFENIDELHEKVNHQKAQLLESTRQNGELAEALQKKEEEMDLLSASLVEQESNNEHREEVIKILSEKEQEQTNIIKILRNNLELMSQADNNLNRQVTEKNSEIETLISNLETTKQQTSNLEKIIMSLQDQARRHSIQRIKEQDKIAMLQNKLAEFEAYHLEADAPAENLDNLIKIIEDELGTPIQPQKDYENIMSKNQYAGSRKRDKIELNEVSNNAHYPPESENFPAKIVMGNFVKKTYITTKEADNLGRKKAITSIDTQKWLSAANHGINEYNPSANRNTNMPNQVPEEHPKTPYLSRNLQSITPDQLRGGRNYKMFKLTGHRL